MKGYTKDVVSFILILILIILFGLIVNIYGSCANNNAFGPTLKEIQKEFPAKLGWSNFVVDKSIPVNELLHDDGTSILIYGDPQNPHSYILYGFLSNNSHENYHGLNSMFSLLNIIFPDLGSAKIKHLVNTCLNKFYCRSRSKINNFEVNLTKYKIENTKKYVYELSISHSSKYNKIYVDLDTTNTIE